MFQSYLLCLLLAVGEQYNPETDRWSSVADMYTPRSNAAVAVLDDMIFVIGGFNGTHYILLATIKKIATTISTLLISRINEVRPISVQTHCLQAI